MCDEQGHGSLGPSFFTKTPRIGSDPQEKTNAEAKTKLESESKKKKAAAAAALEKTNAEAKTKLESKARDTGLGSTPGIGTTKAEDKAPGGSDIGEAGGKAPGGSGIGHRGQDAEGAGKHSPGKSARPPGQDGIGIIEFWRPALRTYISSFRARPTDSCRRTH